MILSRVPQMKYLGFLILIYSCLTLLVKKIKRRLPIEVYSLA